MTARLPHDDFAALIRRAGVSLSPGEVDELYGAWEHVETMLERIRVGVRPRESEPALIFRPEAT